MPTPARRNGLPPLARAELDRITPPLRLVGHLTPVILFAIATAFSESLLAIAGVAVPIIIHLLSRRRYRRVQWAAMEFLRRAMKKTQRRMRIENLILLLLRTLALLLLVMALMRPVLAPLPLLSQRGEEERTVVIAIDDSASMAARGDGTSPFDRARALALEILDNLKARDEVYLLWVSDAPQPVFEGPTPEKRRARQEIEAAQPSDSGTRWAPSLTEAARARGRTGRYRYPGCRAASRSRRETTPR